MNNWNRFCDFFLNLLALHLNRASKRWLNIYSVQYLKKITYVNVDTVQRFFREKFKDFSFEDEKISR